MTLKAKKTGCNVMDNQVKIV